MSVYQAAQRTGLTRQAIHYAIQAGHLRARQLYGRYWLIRAADLDAWLQHGKHTPGPVLGSKHPRKRKVKEQR